MKVLLAGGAGFIGSHLCERLLGQNDEVVCVDDLSSGRMENLSKAIGRSGFSFVAHDVTEELPDLGAVDIVMNLASPASPRDYMDHPIKTLEVGSLGTKRLLDYARKVQARFLLTSTSEVYGDPSVHPQVETYWGNVNPVGPRAVYDEAKRYAEAITFSYAREFDLEVRVARIFNTYGPRIRPTDGRVVSNFICQALANKDLTIYGDGSQTRSLCYVHDQVEGLIALSSSSYSGPVNIGNPDEITVSDLAQLIIKLVGSSSGLKYVDLPQDDPTRRCPNIELAVRELGWKPKTTLQDGLSRTIDWIRQELGSS